MKFRKQIAGSVLTCSLAVILVGCSGRTSSETRKQDTATGLMGGVGADSSDSSAKSVSSASSAEDEIPIEIIGKYVSQGYENPAFGIKVSLPDTWTLQSRGHSDEQEDIVADANSSDIIDYIQTNVESFGATETLFSAEDTDSKISITLQDATASLVEDYSGWASELDVMQNAEDQFNSDPADYLGFEDNTEVTNVQTDVNEILIADQSHKALQFSCTIDGTPYYGADIAMISDDNRYLLNIIITGFDRDEIDQADSYFTAIDVFSPEDEDTGTSDGQNSPDMASMQGTLNGSVWQNPFFGLQCTLDYPWVFETNAELGTDNGDADGIMSEEDLDSKADSGSGYMIMAAELSSDTEYQSVNANITKPDLSQIGNLTLEGIIDELISDDSYKSALERAGYTNIALLKKNVTFLGETIPAVYTTADLYGVQMYMEQVIVVKDSYVLTISAGTALNDNCQDLLNHFSTISDLTLTENAASEKLWAYLEENNEISERSSIQSQGLTLIGTEDTSLIECYLFAFGSNNEDAFVTSDWYAVGTSYGAIYKQDIVADTWEQIQ